MPDTKFEYSFLKEVLIELKGYNFFHSPSAIDKIDERFRGRKSIEKKLSDILDDKKTKTKSGAYLITGFRGVGKTSLVNIVLSKKKYYNKDDFDNSPKLANKKRLFSWLFIWLGLSGAFLYFYESLNFNVFWFFDKLWFLIFLFLLIPLCFLWETIAYKVKKFVVFIGSKLNLKVQKKNAPIIVRINLGHENIAEKDILNSISKSLYAKYKLWHSRPLVAFRDRIALTTLSLVCLVLHYLFLKENLRYGNGVIENFSFLGLKIYTIIENLMSYNFIYCLIFFFFYYQSFRILIRVFFKNSIANHGTAFKKLNFLNNRIDSEVTLDRGITTKKSLFEFVFGKKQTYPIADARDIEIILIEVLEYLDRIPKIFPQPKFIFVFDELDKIEAHQNKTILEKEEYTSIPYSGYSTSAEQTRKRQQAISKILANLKHFFSTARAKFIFVASREMYDATLADISDRNYFLGSIFNDVIYVNSFLTEDPELLYQNEKDKSAEDQEVNHRSYYHSMVEEFLCQFLLPQKSFRYTENDKELIARLDNPKFLSENERRKSISLKTYNLYLKNNWNEGLNSSEDIKKVVLLLNQFVTYLAHRSSGSPKKLTHLLESYICKDESLIYEDKRDKSYYDIRMLKIGSKENSNSKLYLHFDYYSQYTFGLLHYLTVPYYYNISRYVRRYNDKLMVSTSYLLDHLYKFHDFGFSWRNLEVTPEIIDVNKAPTLRKLIEEIVNFLSYTHLQNVISGLYDFKFKKKIAYEINFLSKVSERESAALNFTLDESQEVKGHFIRKMEHISNEYSQKKTVKFIHSKGYLQQSLADLHYYDQEYDDASVMYKEAIQGIQVDEDLSLRLVVILCRITLKLGLTFERKKSFTSALMAYSEISDIIINRLEIDLESIGLLKKKDMDGNIRVYYLENRYGEEVINEYDKNYFNDIFNQPFYSEHYKYSNKSLTTETVRLLYQPFLAKLHVQDKEKLGGITDRDIELALREVSFLTKITNPKIEQFILSEYHNKVGDLLFFMNYRHRYLGNEESYGETHNYFSHHKLYRIALELLKENNEHIIETLIKKLSQKQFNEKDTYPRFEEIQMIASHLSDYGDSCLSNLQEKIDFLNSTELHFIYQLFIGKKSLNQSQIIISLFNNNNVCRIFICYLLSYLFYKKNDDHSKASFQCVKALHLLELNSSDSAKLLTCNEQKTKFLKSINIVIHKILTSIYTSYSSSTRQEVERVKAIFKIYINEERFDENFHHVLNNLPSISEAQEVLMVHQLIKLRVVDLSKESFKHLCELLNPSYYSNLNGMYGRLNSLYVKIRFNYQIFVKMKFPELIPFLTQEGSENEKKEVLNKLYDQPENDIESILKEFRENLQNNVEKFEYLIADTIYCLTETVRILKIFGVTYITNHSTFAFAYEKRAWWCEIFEFYDYAQREYNRENNDNPLSLYTTVRNLIGSQAMSNLRAKYNYEKAVFHFTQALETHKSGYTYDRLSESLYYLEDDFNDNHLHFFTAFERYKINIGKIDKKLQKCSEKLSESKIYLTDWYDLFENPKL